MSSWHSYPSIFAIGHRAAQGLFAVPVNVEEKVDGSQFSFGVFDVDPDDKTYAGQAIKVRSKGAIMYVDAPESLFKEACDTVKRLAPILRVGWTYRGECLKKPKHNALAYDRVPTGNIILFDINDGEESYLGYEAKVEEANRIGLEVVPRLFTGTISNIEEFRRFLESTSILGGCKVEGVVVKPQNYDLYGLDKKVIFGKFVSEAFKEVHGRAWKESNPKSGDILVKLGDKYCHPGRWQKAVQHLLEAGKLEGSPRDIPNLMLEIQKDLGKECEDEIKQLLWKWAWPSVSRASTRGMPEWYKESLLSSAFDKANES